jgi:hypothetical protein
MKNGELLKSYADKKWNNPGNGHRKVVQKSNGNLAQTLDNSSI